MTGAAQPVRDMEVRGVFQGMPHSPRPLQDLVGQVFREHRRQEHVTLATLQQRWAELVGPGLAERTWPTRLQQGRLWIAAPDSSWAYQLQFLKQEILGSLRAGLPAFALTDLRFKVGPLPTPPTPAPAAPASSATEDAPETHANPALARAAETIADPALRGAFLRALTKQARRTDEKR